MFFTIDPGINLFIVEGEIARHLTTLRLGRAVVPHNIFVHFPIRQLNVVIIGYTLSKMSGALRTAEGGPNYLVGALRGRIRRPEEVYADIRERDIRPHAEPRFKEQTRASRKRELNATERDAYLTRRLKHVHALWFLRMSACYFDTPREKGGQEFIHLIGVLRMHVDPFVLLEPCVGGGELDFE